MRFQQFLGKRTSEETVSFAVLSAFGEEGNIFKPCCSTGELLLDLLKVIFTANPFLASLTECWNFRDSAYDVTIVERRAGAYQTKRNTLYKWPEFESDHFFLMARLRLPGTEYCISYCRDHWLLLGGITTPVIDYCRTKNIYVGLKLSGLSESRTSGLVLS